MTWIEFTSSHASPTGRLTRYRVRVEGPLHVEDYHPRYGWLVSHNANTRFYGAHARAKAKTQAEYHDVQ